MHVCSRRCHAWSPIRICGSSPRENCGRKCDWWTEQKVGFRSSSRGTFTAPAIATVGLTEQQAKEKGYEVKTSVMPLDAVPRALVNRETTGVFKLVADAKTLKILGAHVVAENAGDVIYAATLAVKFGLTVEDLRETLAPYLTM